MAEYQPNRLLRKERTETLHRALELCDRVQLALISKRTDIDEKTLMDVTNCIKKRREVFGDEISPLQGAVSLGYYSICKLLVQERAITKSVSSIPHPLCLALQKGHYEIAHLLLKAGADVNLAFEYALPMCFALENKKCPLVVVKDIIAAGFPINGVIHRLSNKTTLHTAVIMNHFSIAKYILSLPINPNVKDSSGLTPINYAVNNNNTVMVKILAKSGVNLNCESQERFTPLFYAIAMRHYDMVKLLIFLGADIHFVNGNKECAMMPLHFAANCCDIKIVQLLLEKGADASKVVPSTGEIALHAAARADCENTQQNKIALDCIVDVLIKHGCDINARHKFDLTPLQVAIKSKNLSVARILISNGAKLNNIIQEKIDKSCTTFHMAAKCFDHDLIKMCIDYGADYNSIDGEGLYPCHLSVLSATLNTANHSADCCDSVDCCNMQNDELSIFKLFWRVGFPYDLTLRFNWLLSDRPKFPIIIESLIQTQKMLFNGVKGQHPKLCQRAICHGAEVNACSTDIPFPVHFIAATGNEMLLRVFLSNGALVNILDNRGETALHIAAKAGFVNCCRLLLEYGAVYNYSSKKCPKTPLEIAMDYGHTEVVTLFSKVEKYFIDIKNGRYKKLKPEMKMCCAVINCCDRNGMTLLSTAVFHNMKEFAERLMKIRVLFYVS